MKNTANILVMAVFLLLASGMFAQQTLGDAARDNRKTSADLPGRKVVHREIPIYPRDAKGIEGNVLLEAVIDKQGNVVSARVIEGDKTFRKSALAAIKAWKFDPATAEETAQIKMRFCPASCW